MKINSFTLNKCFFKFFYSIIFNIYTILKGLEIMIFRKVYLISNEHFIQYLIIIIQHLVINYNSMYHIQRVMLVTNNSKFTILTIWNVSYFRFLLKIAGIDLTFEDCKGFDCLYWFWALWFEGRRTWREEEAIAGIKLISDYRITNSNLDFLTRLPLNSFLLYD